MNENGRIELLPMKDIFDMFSGTSTGSIMSAGFSLSKKNNTDGVYYPKFWANEIRDIYIDNSTTIFQKNYLQRFWNFLVYLLYFVVFGIIFYFAGFYRYDNPKIKNA